MSRLCWVAPDQDTEPGCAFVPAVRAIHLKNIGPFADAHVQFGPRLNFVLGEGATGKSTLLWAIEAGVTNLRAASPSVAKPDAAITVEFRKSQVSWTHPKLNSHHRSDRNVGGGERAFLALQGWIERLTSDFALLFDSDIFGVMPEALLTEAFRMLTKSAGQIVTVLPRRFAVDDLTARKLEGRVLIARRRADRSEECTVEAGTLNSGEFT